MTAAADMLKHGLMITGFVFIMMLVIEYLNVLTRGNWDRVIARWTWGQSALCAFLGATPGCLGAYAVASLYMHRVISFGALLAAMLATCGDEAFVMLALFPRQALLIFACMFAGGLGVGLLVDLITRSRRTAPIERLEDYHAAHDGVPDCIPFSRRQLFEQWRHCSPHRGWLTLMLALFLVGVLSNAIGHSHLHTTHAHAHEGHEAMPLIDHEPAHDTADVHREHDQHDTHAQWDWVRVTLLALGIIGLLIVATVPDHFLDEHLWRHLVRVHAWRIFLWTLGALAITELMVSHMNVEAALHAHRVPVLLIACLVGLLPASGPHLVFVTLYAEDALPLSILLANCLVQDGHGLIPTLAHSRRAFLAVKGIKLAIGVAVGLAGYLLGW